MKETEVEKKQRREKEAKECCVGCAVHHNPDFNLQETLGECSCPCHKPGEREKWLEKWPLASDFPDGVKTITLVIMDTPVGEVITTTDYVDEKDDSKVDKMLDGIEFKKSKTWCG